MMTHRCLFIALAITGLAAASAPAAEPKEKSPAAVPAPEKRNPDAETPARTVPGPIEVKAGAKPEEQTAGKPAAAGEQKPAGNLVEFNAAPASEVIGFVADRAKVNIVFDPACAEKLKTPITFKARGMTCRQVLDWATKLSGTAWKVADEAVYVTSEENVPKVDVVEAVRKFIAEHPKFVEQPPDFPPPPEMEMGFPGVK